MSELVLKKHKKLYDKAFELKLDKREEKPIYKPGFPLSVFVCDDGTPLPKLNACNLIFIDRNNIVSGELFGIDDGYASLLILSSSYIEIFGFPFIKQLILSDGNLRILESPEGLNLSFEFSSILYGLLTRHYYDLSDGRMSMEDILANQMKLEYFSLSRSHPVMNVNGKKLASYLYLNEYGVNVPKLYSACSNGRVYGEKIEDFLNRDPNDFVLKAETGCSGVGVHVLKRQDEGGYFDFLQNKALTKTELFELSKEYGDFFVEEKLGSQSSIPMDIKCYSYNGELKYIMLFNRNYKKSHGAVFVLGYNLAESRIENNPFLNYQRRFVSPKDDDIYKSMVSDFLDIGVNSIVTFVEGVLERIKCKDFLSVDIFSHGDGELYVGEVTKTPGAFFHHVMRSQDIRNIFS